MTDDNVIEMIVPMLREIQSTTDRLHTELHENRMTTTEQRMYSMESRIASVESRTAKVEARLAGIDDRLERIERCLGMTAD